MRIAYVSADPGVPVFGWKGASLHVQELIRAFRKLGCSVELFSPRVDGDAPADLADLLLHALPVIPKGDQAWREQALLAGNRSLYELLQREGPFDLVYERYSLWSLAGMEYARAAGIPGLLEVNAPLIEEQAAFRGLVDRAGAQRVAERVFADATNLIAVSPGVRAYLERYPAVRGRVHVVANGVNPERFPAAVAATRPGLPGSLTVGFVGSLQPWHGLSILVEAFDVLRERCPQARLLVVGDGPERRNLMADLAARRLTGVAEMTGAVAPTEIAGLLASMDVAVAPYPQQDNFYFSPLKIYEYMASGVAVVASRVGELSDLIEDGTNGLLCPPGDAVALTGALMRLQQDAELRTRLGRAARETVLRDHTWNAIARRLLNVAGMEESGRARVAEVRL